jgi:hypothetical protein
MHVATRVAAVTLLAVAAALLGSANAGAAPSFRSVSSASTATASSTLSVPKPAGVVVGDVLVAVVDLNGHVTAAVTPPAGWSLVRRDGTSAGSSAAFSQAVYAHVAGQLEPASYAWQFGSTRSAAAGIAAYAGIDTAGPVVAHSGRMGSYTRSIVAPSVTTSAAETVVVGVYGTRGVRSITPPAGSTERLERSSGGPNEVTVAVTDRPHLPGATGDLTAASDPSARRAIGQLVALRPLFASPPPPPPPPPAPPPPPPPPPPGGCPTLMTSTPVPGYCTGQVISVTPATFGTGTFAVSPGDVVVFEDGTYTDTNGDGAVMRITGSGTSSQWVTFVSRTKWGAHMWGNNNDAAEGIVLQGADYVRVEGFQVSEVGNVGSPRGSSSGIDLYNGGKHSHIVGNHVHHVGRVCANPDNTNGQVGIYVQTGKSGGAIIVENNLVHDVGRFFVGEKGCGNTTFSLDHGMYLNGGSSGGGGASNVTIRNNIFHDTHHGWGIQWYPGSLDNVHVLNNTFASCNESKSYTCIVLDASISSSSIKNNVFYNPEGGKTIEAVGFSGTITIGNNVTSGSAMHDRSSTPSGMTLRNNQLSTDAKLIGPPADFRLQSTSPAIDAGEAIASVTQDFDGAGRPFGSAWDVGAFEFR